MEANVIHPVPIQQQINFHQALILQRRQFIETRLKENFPIKANVIYIVSLVLSAILGIAFEAILIADKTEENTVFGGGIWGGATALVCAAFAYILQKKRSYGWYHANIFAQSFGCTIIFTGYAALNIGSVVMGTSCFEIDCSQYDLVWINITLLAVGCALFIYTLVYLIALSYSINGGFYYNAFNYGFGAPTVIITQQPSMPQQAQFSQYGAMPSQYYQQPPPSYDSNAMYNSPLANQNKF